MAVARIQPSFTGGEFSPALYSRVDLQKYITGLKRCRNMIIHPEGGISNRPGTKFVAETKYSDKTARLVEFEFSVTQAYVIEFGDLYIRFFKDGGQIIDSASPPDPYEIVSPYTEADLPNLKFTQSADVLYICHPDHAPMELARYDHDDWELTAFVFENGPFRNSNIDAAATLFVNALTGSTTMVASEDTFTVDNIGSLFKLVHQIPGQSDSGTYTASVTGNAIQCGGTWRVISHGTWTAKFKIEKSIDNGSTWTELRLYSSNNDFNVNTFGEEEDDEPFLIRINVSSYTSGTIYIDLTSDPYEQVGIVKVSAYSTTKLVDVIVQKTVGSTAVTSDWAEGSWSTRRGWPSCVTFYQERLCFGSNVSEPQTIWMSVAGDYNNFERNSPLLDTDGITTNLPARKMNGVRNLVGLSEMLALTSASEWAISSGGQGALTPSNVNQKIQGYRGSSNEVEPIIIGNRIIYVQRLGGTVRDLGYDFGVNGFQGDILNIYSKHLLKNYTLLDMTYQEEPDSIVWFVRDDGIMLSLTYLREQDVLGWSWHDTQGLFESVCSIPAETYNQVWIVVKRGNKRFVEYFEERSTSTDPRKQYFVDCGLSYNSYLAITDIDESNATVTSASHGLLDDTVIDILEVEGLEKVNTDGDTVSAVNGQRFIVSDATTHTFRLKEYDSGEYLDLTDYSAYEQGGEIYEVTSSISGFDHLEGESVAVLADGSVLRDKVVDTGTIDLGVDAGIVHAGLPFVAEMISLNVEFQDQVGTIQGRKVQIPSVTLRFENSAGGYLGTDENHLDEMSTRTDEEPGQPVRLFTEDKRISMDSSYDSNGKIVYRQPDPLPVTILSIVPEVVVGGYSN